MVERARRPVSGRDWSTVAPAFTVLFVTTGVYLSFGILFKPILAELGTDRATLALAATTSLGVSALSQPFIGGLVDRIGPRWTILPSMALMALGTALLAVSREPWQAILAYGVLASAGYTGSSILPVSVHVGRWFPGGGGAALAVAASGFSLGQLVFSQIATYAAGGLGWRVTYGLFAAILLLFLAVTAVWLRDAPHPPETSAPREAAKRVSEPPFRTPAFWWMTGAFMGCGFTDFLLTTHLPAFATDLGLAPGVAANAMSLWALANITGTLTAGVVAARLGARVALVLTYLVRATALFFLPSVRETWQLYLFALLFGATFFTTAPLSSTLITELFGAARHGMTFGMANLFHHMAGALGSYAGGLVFDMTGSYGRIFFASAVIVTASAAFSALARPPRRSPL